MFYDQKFVRKVKKSGWNLKVTRIMGGIIKTISMPWILPLNCMHLWLQIMKTVNIDRHNISYKHIYNGDIGVSPVRICYAGQTMCTSARLHPFRCSQNLSQSFLSKRKARKLWEFSPFKWWRVFIYSFQMEFFHPYWEHIKRKPSTVFAKDQGLILSFFRSLMDLIFSLKQLSSKASFHKQITKYAVRAMA